MYEWSVMFHVLSVCSLMFMYSLMFVCVLMFVCILMFLYSPMPSCILMFLCSPMPWTHALVHMPLIPDSLSVSLLVVSCYPTSIVLSLVFHGFVYVLPVWSFIKPLLNSFTASHPVTWSPLSFLLTTTACDSLWRIKSILKIDASVSCLKLILTWLKTLEKVMLSWNSTTMYFHL